MKMVKRKKRKYTKRDTKRAKTWRIELPKNYDVATDKPYSIKEELSVNKITDVRFNCLVQASSYAFSNGLNENELLQMAHKFLVFCTTGKIRQRKGK